MSPLLQTILSAGVGAAVSAFSAILVIWITKRYEDKRQFREVVLKAAIENWKQQHEDWKTHQRAVRIAPLDLYVLNMVKLVELVLDKRVTAHNIDFKLQEIDRILAKAKEHIKKRGIEDADAISAPAARTPSSPQ